MLKVPLLTVITLFACGIALMTEQTGPPKRVAPKQVMLSSTRPEITALIHQSGAEAVSVAVFDLKTDDELLINEHTSYHAASTMKVPVMMELFEQSTLGRFRMTDSITVRNDFRSIVDGSPFQLDPKTDSDAEMYQKVGSPVTYHELIFHMITRSSNLATNLLIEKIGAPSVMSLMKQLQANEIQVLRGVEDGKAFDKGLNNTTTAYDLMILLRALAQKQVVTPAACDEMIEILSAQEFNAGIPSGIPAGVKVAHKTGAITRVHHDAAIVYPKDRQPYVLVVLTKGIPEEAQSDKLIAQISRIVYKTLAPGEKG